MQVGLIGEIEDGRDKIALVAIICRFGPLGGDTGLLLNDLDLEPTAIHRGAAASVA